MLGEDGPITVAPGRVQIGADGTVRSGGVVAGKLSVVEFAEPSQMVREGGAILRAPEGATPLAPEHSQIRTGALEDSNVSMVDRVAELTSVSRTFEALQRSLSVLMNDVDGRSIDALGKR
ncbi:MAG: flagellar basal body rod C-terminal domain-containing protein [Vicinamibacterales bacterium]